MTVTAIILAHYKERESNLHRIVSDLNSGTVKPTEIVVFIDNPDIEFESDVVTIIRSNKGFLPKIRFILGSYFPTDYCFFIDDDLTVRNRTLENFVEAAKRLPRGSIIGLQGSILADTENPYADDTPINRGLKDIDIEVDVIIRTYFVPTDVLLAGSEIQLMHPHLPQISLDDVYLCLGNKYLNANKNYAISVDANTDLVELNDGGMGQSYAGIHYENRNIVCRELMETYG